MFYALGQRIGRRIGERVINDMIERGEIEKIVKATMAREWDRLADLPEYAHCAPRLRAMARRLWQEIGI